MPQLQPRARLPDQTATNRRLLRRLRELTEEAGDNEAKFKRFQERELSLLTAEDLPQLLHTLTRGMKDSFRLTRVNLVLLDDRHELRHLLLHTGVSTEAFPDILFVDRMMDASPLLDGLARPWLGPFLGGDQGRLFPGEPEVQSVALLPMILRHRLIGSLNLGSEDAKRFTRHHASDFLYHLATIGAVCLENAANREHLVLSGLTDPLTGLHNRRYLERRLSEEIPRARRYGLPLSCLFIDADRFKAVNDRHGHNVGDQVLREISLRIRECLRASDIATRFGGEEFALLLPQTDADEALHLAERIRSRIAAEAVAVEQAGGLQITVSVGVSELHQGGDDVDGEALIAEADAALYQAKKLGRNRVRMACLPPARGIRQ